MDYVALGAAIRKKRTERGWKIAELADRAGVSDDFIGKIERATDIPSLQTTVAIANALDVGVDTLIGNDLYAVTTYLCDELNELIGNMDSKQKKLFLQFVRHNLQFFTSNYFEHFSSDY